MTLGDSGIIILRTHNFYTSPTNHFRKHKIIVIVSALEFSTPSAQKGSSQSQCSALQCKVWLPHQCVVRKGPGVPLGSASRPPTNHSYSMLVIETMSWKGMVGDHAQLILWMGPMGYPNLWRGREKFHSSNQNYKHSLVEVNTWWEWFQESVI